MSLIDKRLLVMAACLGWAAAIFIARAESTSLDRNYRVIIDRNPFGLKPPPPPQTNAPAETKPKDEILLTGITSIGSPRAYFMSKAPQGKNPEYYSLKVSDKQNGLEVLDIDIMSKSVRVRNAGVEAVMTFASNGVKPPATPAAAPPPTPGAPAMPGAVSLPSMTTPPTASINPPGLAPSVTPGPPASSTSGRPRSVPSRNMRTPTVGGVENFPNQPAARPDPYAAERDVLLMELQKKAAPGVAMPPTPGLPE